MKPIKAILLLLFVGSISVVLGQEGQQVRSTLAGQSDISNLKKVKIASVSSFKLPLSVEVFATGELDSDHKTNVVGRKISGKVSSVSNMGGGASSASYAKVKVTITQPESGDTGSTMTDENGNFSIEVVKDSLHIISVNGVVYGQVRVKTKHDTVKNSVGNIR